MQPSSTMYSVSPAEDLLGRLQAHKVILRKGQKDLIQYVSDHPEQSVYNGVLPCGYGKSLVAECVCDILKQQGRATRFLFVVPTDTQRTQYSTGIGDDVANLGINLRLEETQTIDGDKSFTPVVIEHKPSDIRRHRENLCEVFITTIQSIHANPTFYNGLMETGTWCVFADEYQKLSIEGGAKWGKALEALPRNVLLGLTATPVRTDKRDTVFAEHDPDVAVSFKEAYEEKAVRGVIAHLEHYFVHILEAQEDGSTIVRKLTTEEIGDGKLDNAPLISKQLRFTTKYCADIISSAYNCLVAKSQYHPDQHQMLVFAMNVSHAESVSDLLNDMYGQGTSEWIGVGPSGKPTKENRAIIERYKKNKFPCLVQVDIATEGFDNPRSSVIVFLSLIREASVKALQGSGRGVRRNREIDDFYEDICDMFTSPDVGIAEVIQDLANQTVDPASIGEYLPEPEVDPDHDPIPRVITIPPLGSLIKDSVFDRSELISQIPKAEFEGIRDDLKKDLSEAGSEVSDDRLERMIENAIVKRMENTRRAAEARNNGKFAREQVTRAVSLLARNVIHILHPGDTIAKNLTGDLIKVIHTQWVRLTGMKSADMLDKDFIRKHEWIVEINAELQSTRRVPSWLQL